MLRQVLGNYKHYIIGYFKNQRQYSEYATDAVFVCGAPEYGNLGDQAILFAEIAMLHRVLPGRQIVVIPELQMRDHLICLRKFTHRHHNLCVFLGGGNFGELYTFQETNRLRCVKTLKEANLIVFPQSIDYQADSKGLPKAKHIYESHASLWLFVREEASERKRLEFFSKCNGALVPDIVLSYYPAIHDKNREGVLFCTRSDKEKKQGNDKILQELQKCAASVFTSIRHTDTYSEKFRKPYEQQFVQLQTFLESYANAELIITDRLHGMIFAIITGTPCIALDNSTGKVGSLYRTWLQGSGVIFVEDALSLERAKRFIVSKAYQNWSPNFRKKLDKAFAPLENAILKFK